MARRIFLSYGHDEHRTLAERLKEDLQARGHEVWFDADRLIPGADWEQYIEEGLEWAAAIPDRGRVVLVMTPHSVRRPDGYCLNEIARALSRRLTVVPVMVVWCEPPLSICRVQWLDMRDCVPLDAQAAKYEAKLEILAAALESAGPEFEGAFVRLSHVLEPLPFDADLLPHLPHFTGRTSIRNALAAWLADKSAARVFWITGVPGIGKTALAAWLCHHKAEVVAFHLCARGHSLKADPRRCILSIAFQLASQLPDYQTRLTAINLEQLIRETDARTIFDVLISQPLSGLPRPSGDLVVLVDGLDEASREGTNPLASLLASEFPKTPGWLRLIVTSALTADVTFALQGLKPFPLGADAEENRRDLRDYLAAALARRFPADVVPPEIVERILDRSEGLFLYVDALLRDLPAGRLSLERLSAFPRGLGGIYAQYFERQFPDVIHYQHTARPVLETMAASQEPLSLDIIASIHGLDEYAAERIRADLGSLFPFVDDVPRPFHGSLMAWLTTASRAGPYYVSPKKGHARIASFIWSKYRDGGRLGGRYGVRHALVHLRTAGELENAFALLQDDAYLGEFLRYAPPDVLREEIYQCWAAVEAVASAASIREHAPAAACMAHGLYRIRNNDVPGGMASFEKMPDGPSAVLAVLTWNELAWLTKDYARENRRESMERAVRALVDATRRIPDDRLRPLSGEALRSAGWMFKDLDLIEDAEHAFRQSMEIFEKLDVARQVAWTKRDLGCLYRDMGRRYSAAPLLRESEETFRLLGDRRQLAVTVKDFGVLSLEAAIEASDDRAQLADRADRYFREALDLCEALAEHDQAAWVQRYRGLAEGLRDVAAGRALIALSRGRFELFRESNQALCDYLSAHIEDVRHPHLLELFGRLQPSEPATYSRLLQ
jgi:tetratricopeptide (TPR) repeat protein